jgi:beta-mannosidase
VDGRILSGGHKKVRLRYGQSLRQQSLDLAKPLAAHGRDNLYLRIALEIDGVRVSEETVFLTPPRFVALPKPKTTATIRVLTPHKALLTFRSPVFQHRFAFELPGIPHHSSDNYFELYPNEQKEILVEFARPVTKTALAKSLTFQSLVDTY